MQSAPANQIAKLRGHYRDLDLFEHEGEKVRVVAHVMWTCKKSIQHWVFKLSNKKIIKVDL